MSWVRLWVDMPTDPIWRVIAKRSNQRIGDVISTFIILMTQAAANASERGRTNGNDDDEIAAALNLESEDISAIRHAMQGKVMEGDFLTGWEKRQPKREDNSAERAKQWREERKRTQANAEKRSDADENITEPDGSGADAPDPASIIFTAGVRLLVDGGAKEASARSMLGKWRKLHGDASLIAALGTCQRAGAINPIEFIEGIFRDAGKKPGNGFGNRPSGWLAN